MNTLHWFGLYDWPLFFATPSHPTPLCLNSICVFFILQHPYPQPVENHRSTHTLGVRRIQSERNVYVAYASHIGERHTPPRRRSPQSQHSTFRQLGPCSLQPWQNICPINSPLLDTRQNYCRTCSPSGRMKRTFWNRLRVCRVAV